MLEFKRPQEWADLREATKDYRDAVLVTKGEHIWCWGLTDDIRACFGETLRVSLDRKDDRNWLLLEPDIWVWPTHARAVAMDFLNKRKGQRYNGIHNQLLNAWTEIILATSERNAELSFRPFDGGSEAEAPTFHIGSRTAFSRKLTA